jgi:hypothetical protein
MARITGHRFTIWRRDTRKGVRIADRRDLGLWAKDETLLRNTSIEVVFTASDLANWLFALLLRVGGIPIRVLPVIWHWGRKLFARGRVGS